MKKIEKRIFLVTLFTVLLTLTVLFAGCDEYDCSVDGHIYDATAHKCTACGETNIHEYGENGRCSCGELDPEHVCSFSESSRQEPTCDKEGVMISSCICGKTDEEKLDALGHNFGENTLCTRCEISDPEHKCSFVERSKTEATCTKDGSIHSECVCGRTEDSKLAALGHDFGEDSVCSRCKLADPDHVCTFKESTGIKPTCKKEGRIDYICACGKTNQKILPMLEHSYDEGKICTSCGDVGVDHVCQFIPKKRVEPTCTEDGKQLLSCRCGKNKTETIDALGHSFPTGDHASQMLWCENEGCYYYIGLPDKDKSFENSCKYTFSSNDITRIDALYDRIAAAIEAVGAYDKETCAYDESSELYTKYIAWEKDLYELDEEVTWLYEQYQYAYILNDISGSDTKTAEALLEISNYSEKINASYSGLYRLAYDSAFREYAFYGLDDATIEAILAASDTESDPLLVELNNRITEIMSEYRTLDQASSEKVLELYAELVEINNRIAKIYGYDNYMDYAYEVIYAREYTPDDAEVFYNYVKEYISPLLDDHYLYYAESHEELDSLTDAQYEKLEGILYGSFFDSIYANRSVNDFLARMDGSSVSFTKLFEDVMSNGNYFTGAQPRAYTWYIDSKATPIMFFGEGYQDPSTVIHEFGHYVNMYYNVAYSQSYDLNETHSQGLEILFLSDLKNQLDQKSYDLLYSEEMYMNLIYMILPAAVDKFERSVYTNEYDGYGYAEIMADNVITSNEYDTLFTYILIDIGGAEHMNPSYWRYVAIENPGYYISYSISLACSLQLLADETNFDEMRDAYISLITYTNTNPNMTYAQVLEAAGLESYSNEELFIKLREALLAKLTK